MPFSPHQHLPCPEIKRKTLPENTAQFQLQMEEYLQFPVDPPSALDNRVALKNGRTAKEPKVVGFFASKFNKASTWLTWIHITKRSGGTKLFIFIVIQ